MPDSFPQYELGETEYQRALAVLDQVEESLRLPRWQRILSTIYNFLAIAFLFFASSYGLALLWRVDASDFPSAVGLLSLIGAILAMFAAMVLIPFNLPLLIKIFRQKAALRKLGMRDTWIGFLRRQGGIKRSLRVARGIVFVVGIGMVLTGIVMFLVDPDHDYASLFWVDGIGLVLIMYYLLQEAKIWRRIVSARFDEIRDLKKKMVNLEKGPGNIAVPRELIGKLAKIQSDQILIDRANAVAQFKPNDDLYSVLNSRRLLQQKAKLDAGVRLKVEEVIEELMQNPRTPSRKTVDGTELSCPIMGTDFEIVYSVDQKEHRLHLTELRPATAEAPRA